MKYIQLTGKDSDKYAIVSDEDYEWLNQYSWYFNGGYVVRYVPAIERKMIKAGRMIKMHRQILGLQYGDKREVDHIDHNKFNNDRNNIRICTRHENSMNRTKHKKTSYTNKGIFKHGKYWQASIKVNQKTINLGNYNSEYEASLAYDKAAREYFGEYAHLNYPEIINYNNINKRPRSSKSGNIGIHWKEKLQKWTATYYDPKTQKHKHIKYCSTIEEALLAQQQYIKGENNES